MFLIPAIDLKNGKCVRLIQGDPSKETIYSNDPVHIAKLWVSQGAKRLHIVDLDGAFSGKSCNFDIIQNIRKNIDIVIEVGGGIRDIKTINKMFEIGINKVILGTAAIENTELVKEVANKYKDKIIVGVDASNGFVATHGWKYVQNVKAIDLINKMTNLGVNEFIYTDISKDGMMQGPNIEAVEDLCNKTKANIIVSGGVSCLEDIKVIKRLEKPNIIGIILGKALYTKEINLQEAINVS